MDEIRWGRDLVNGLFAWLISVAVTVFPGLAYAFTLAGKLGPQGMDPATISQEISRQVTALYADNWVLLVGVIVISAVVILWRAWAAANGTWHRRWINGLIVGCVPAVLSLLTVLCSGFGVLDAVTIGVYLVAGLLGGILARP